MRNYVARQAGLPDDLATVAAADHPLMPQAASLRVKPTLTVPGTYPEDHAYMVTEKGIGRCPGLRFVGSACGDGTGS